MGNPHHRGAELVCFWLSGCSYCLIERHPIDCLFGTGKGRFWRFWNGSIYGGCTDCCVKYYVLEVETSIGMSQEPNYTGNMEMTINSSADLSAVTGSEYTHCCHCRT